jgi:hypothetical protein
MRSGGAGKLLDNITSLRKVSRSSSSDPLNDKCGWAQSNPNVTP